MIPCSFSTFSSSLSSPSLSAPPATQGLAVNIPPEIVSIIFTDSEYSDIHSLFVKIPLGISQRFKALLMWLFVHPKSENPTQGWGRDHPTTCSSKISKWNSKFKIQNPTTCSCCRQGSRSSLVTHDHRLRMLSYSFSWSSYCNMIYDPSHVMIITWHDPWWMSSWFTSHLHNYIDYRIVTGRTFWFIYQSLQTICSY